MINPLEIMAEELSIPALTHLVTTMGNDPEIRLELANERLLSFQKKSSQYATAINLFLHDTDVPDAAKLSFANYLFPISFCNPEGITSMPALMEIINRRYFTGKREDITAALEEYAKPQYSAIPAR